MRHIDTRSIAQRLAEAPIGRCHRGHECAVIEVTSMSDNAPRHINGMCVECADLCDWCDHHRNDHSLILAGRPCLVCGCPGFYQPSILAGFAMKGYWT